MKRPKNATPRRVMREMGLGIEHRRGSTCIVVAGVARNWWLPDFLQPDIRTVKAKLLRMAA